MRDPKEREDPQGEVWDPKVCVVCLSVSVCVYMAHITYPHATAYACIQLKQSIYLSTSQAFNI